MNNAPQELIVWFELDDEARRCIYRPLSLVLDLKQGVFEMGGHWTFGRMKRRSSSGYVAAS